MSRLSKDATIAHLGNALKAAIGEVRRDPEFIGRVVATICAEFGLDALASMYIANKLKAVIKEKPGA